MYCLAVPSSQSLPREYWNLVINLDQVKEYSVCSLQHAIEIGIAFCVLVIAECTSGTHISCIIYWNAGPAGSIKHATHALHIRFI